MDAGAKRGVVALLIAVTVLVGGCAKSAPSVVYASVAPPRAYHLHLPGIGGYRRIDKNMLIGLEEGGLNADVQEYDWTMGNPGLASLLGVQRHTVESARVAKLITNAVAAHHGAARDDELSQRRGGDRGVGVEQCPDNVQIDDLLMLSPALSPDYDLSKALKHIRGHLYVIYSDYDVAVLGVGTSLFGTMDGEKVEAAGKVGFTRPAGADAAEYAKLEQVPFDSDWIRLGNIGDHIGSMSRPFARTILAPLLLRNELVKLPPLATTRTAVAAAATQPVR